MFGLAPFAGAPFASVLQISTDVPETGLVATAYLGNITVGAGVDVPLTGLATLVYLADPQVPTINPLRWTEIVTNQYSST